MCERNQYPLALVANYQMTPPHFNTYQSSYKNPQIQQQFPPSQYGSIHPTQHYSSTYPSEPQFNHSFVPPSYPYHSQMNHQTLYVSQIAYQSPQVTTQPMAESPLVDSCLAVLVFSLGDDPIAYLNKAMAFLTVVTSSREDKGKFILVLITRVMILVLGETMQVDRKRLLNATTVKVKDTWLGNALTLSDQRMQHDPWVSDGQAVQIIILHNVAFQTHDLDTYDYDCNDVSNAKAVLMANISIYGSDVVLEEQADILQGIVEQAKAKQPLDSVAKKVAATPKNNVKKVRFAEPLTSSSNIKQVESSKTSDSNTPLLSPIGLKCFTSNCESKPTCNKKNDRILQTSSRNIKNIVEAQPRKVNKKNHVVEPICDVDVKQTQLNANFELICATCMKSMFNGVHDMCLF
nr:hypothetical protein [Tanacetum cinerariifolium]